MSNDKGLVPATGQKLERINYPKLYKVIGTVYNKKSDAKTEFRLPDLRGRI